MEEVFSDGFCIDLTCVSILNLDFVSADDSTCSQSIYASFVASTHTGSFILWRDQWHRETVDPFQLIYLEI